jgi:hypothetical protein
VAQHPHALVRTHTLGAYRVSPCGALPDGRDLGPNGEPGWRLDWFIEADLLDAEEGRTVNYSASLVCALNEGTFSDPWERPIPPNVMVKLEALADRLADAGLF